MLPLRGLRNVRACFQILIGPHFEMEAFQKLRSSGVIAGTPAGLFGQEVADALR